MSKSRPHELYRVCTDYVHEQEHVTRYVFGIDNVPAARDRAIEDCGIWPAFVRVYEWTGKRRSTIDCTSVNGGVMWYEKSKVDTALDDL